MPKIVSLLPVYPPECFFAYEYSEEIQTVKPGDRIAQLILMPYIPMDFIEVGELEETERGAGGFGSTGE